MKWLDCEFRPWSWLPNILNIKGKKFSNGLNGFYYFIRCFFERTVDNPIEEIDGGSNILFIPGTAHVPKNLKKFKKYSDLPVTRVGTKSIEELHDIIEYTIKKHKKIDIICFSFGANIFEQYVNKYGFPKINHLYVLAYKPINIKDKITYFYGNRDFIAAAFVFDVHLSDKIYVIHGGHTFFFSDKKTIKQIAKIIKNG